MARNPFPRFILTRLDHLAQVGRGDIQSNETELADKGDRSPIAITRHGRRKYVVTSAADYDNLMEIKKAALIDKLNVGIRQLKKGQLSEEPISDIIAEAKRRHAKQKTRARIERAKIVKDDLIDIWLFIAADNPVLATETVEEIDPSYFD